MALYQGRTTFLEDGVAQGRASVRIHNVTTFDNGTFHCQFNDSTVSAEATLWLRVADPASRWFRSTAWKIALPLILVAAVLGVATIISLLWTRRRGKNGKLLEEEGARGQRSGTCHCLVGRDPNSTGLPLQTMGAHAEPCADFPHVPQMQ
ncbi:butyrophilin-like protein 10 [Equus quagga]|uniref:butyrophilin-like protein 10 n=1 Tax=Equus quagga TaxID=89248 RepID=UPI001EE281FD|nr:butyrophilin-like protein 10 [Equus quagga]